MEFENITVTDKGVVRLKRITIVIPFFNDRDKEIEITTSNRELIHIAINRQRQRNRNNNFKQRVNTYSN